jgi:2-dehydro-3-deoxyphosphooctonate aldolase (KDO 8-P synthase)
LPGGEGADRRAERICEPCKAAAGVDGLFIEVHPNPNHALSDASSMLPLNGIETLLKRLKAIFETVRKW